MHTDDGPTFRPGSGAPAKPIELAQRDLGDRGSSLPASREELRRRAIVEMAARSRRAQLFGSDFGELAWEMLLTLYINDVGGPRLTIDRLRKSTDAPPTTALRWLGWLEKQQLVRRETHPTDARSSIVRLTDEARTSLDLYFAERL